MMSTVSLVIYVVLGVFLAFLGIQAIRNKGRLPKSFRILYGTVLLIFWGAFFPIVILTNFSVIAWLLIGVVSIINTYISILGLCVLDKQKDIISLKETLKIQTKKRKK